MQERVWKNRFRQIQFVILFDLGVWLAYLNFRLHSWIVLTIALFSVIMAAYGLWLTFWKMPRMLAELRQIDADMEEARQQFIALLAGSRK